ncbi:MAG TPA: HAMP domain-containing sensor histidine kinase [Nitrososphaeraceae archaeon]
MKNTVNAPKPDDPARYKEPSNLAEVIKKQNLELKRKNLELAQLNSDLRDSFEALSELNIKLRAINDELRSRNKIQAEFINAAAHELRTPTQSIMGYCQMLASFPNDSKDSKDYLERLARNADRLYTLISDLLDATRLDIGMLKLVKSEWNLTDIIVEVIDEMKDRSYFSTKDNKKVRKYPIIEPIFPSHPIIIHADKQRITQVMINLLSNAINFTDSGSINVSINPPRGNLVKVSVKDSGKGIDPEIQHKLFEKFTSKSDKGIGLGLFISKYIIEAHGGSITGKNNRHDRGATFSFTLPVVSKK